MRLLHLGLLIYAMANGMEPREFFHKYKDHIQEYIMTGHENGWKNCDILSDYSTSYDERETQISMNLDKINTLNIKTTFTSSSCLLINYDISSQYSLKKLVDFGWEAHRHIRLALVIKMHSGITMNMITNTTKLPFLIAAKLDQDKEQFLCPVVGEIEPLLEDEMCNPSYASPKRKKLRVALLGIPPYFMLTKTGQIDGTDIRLMRILEQRHNFKADVIIPQSYYEAEIMVSNFYFIYLLSNLIKGISPETGSTVACQMHTQVKCTFSELHGT